MIDVLTSLTRGGEVWTPQFVIELDEEKCIGCGRCFKVCPRDVLEIVQRATDDVDFDDMDDDDYDDDDDSDNSYMVLANALDCIGCEACSRVCPKRCFTHSPMPLAA
jgi:Nif-specific ferredoxin III